MFAVTFPNELTFVSIVALFITVKLWKQTDALQWVNRHSG